jgi:heme exporter protein CcmD
MHNEYYIWAAYGLTWIVLLAFTGMTLRRVRRAERAAHREHRRAP